MQHIKFDKATHFDSRGRNGYLTTHGLALCDMGNGDFAEVHLHPVTGRGTMSEACRITIRKSAIPNLVAALLEAAGTPA